jgi:lysophospholipase L1-like esterase
VITPRFSRLKWALRFVLFQILALVVLLEIALRVFQPVVFRVRGDEIVLPVNQVYRITHEGSAKIDPVVIHTKNALGFRGPDPPADFSERLTIVTIGGSTTECVNLTDGRTWSDELQRRLENAFPGAWVNNAGIDGQSTFGHLVLLRSVITRLRPKVAVFLIGANDVGLAHSNTFDVGTIPTPSRFRSIQNAVIAHSEVANMLLNFARAARARERGFGHSELDLTRVEDWALDDDHVAQVLEQHRAHVPGYAARLKEIAALTRSAGSEPVWLTQPALYGPTTDVTTGVNLTRVKVNGRGNGLLEWRLLELHNDVMRRVASDERVLLIDLARELPKDSKYFYDFLHFTNEGAARVGSIVAGHLEPYLRTKYRS